MINGKQSLKSLIVNPQSLIVNGCNCCGLRVADKINPNGAADVFKLLKYDFRRTTNLFNYTTFSPSIRSKCFLFKVFTV